MARRNKNTPEEEALIRAQTSAIPQELALKARIADQQQAQEVAKTLMLRDIEGEKARLGFSELGQKEKQGNIAGALEAFGLGSKERMAKDVAGSNLVSDVLGRRLDIPVDTLGEALAAEGHPGLYNTNAKAKASKREATINEFIPQITGAKSDDERNKNIRPLLSAYPGAYEEALGRAFPKPGFKPTPSAPELWAATTPPTNNAATSDPYSLLANSLLEKGGVSHLGGAAPSGPTTPAGTPIIPEQRFTPLGEKALYGSTRTDGGIRTPSGGFIGGEFSDERLARLTGHPVNPPAPAVAAAPNPANFAAPTATFAGPNAATAGAAFSGLPQNNAIAPQAAPTRPEFQPPTAAFTGQPAAAPAGTPTPNQTGILKPAFEGGQSGAQYLYGRLPQGVRDFASGAVPPEIAAQQQLEEQQRRARLALGR